MLSLPLILPTFEANPTIPTPFRPRPESPPPAPNTQSNNPQHTRLLQQRRDEERKTHNARSPLALLNADEAAIAASKAAIRNFGSYWIRPPGVTKTLQAMSEEEAERLELEEMERQQAGLRDLEARQQLAEAREQAEAAGEGEGVAERDLDEDIPDADAQAETAGQDGMGEMSFNEESLIEGGSMMADPQVLLEATQDDEAVQEELELEEAELTGIAQEEAELGIERDLDDSVPEAGSYQHTDTEVEDTDSDSDLQDSFALPSLRRSSRTTRGTAQVAPGGESSTNSRPQAQNLGALQDRLRSQAVALTPHDLPRSPGSLNLSSSLLESSFVGTSSPVMQRGGHRGRGRRRGHGS